MMKSGIKNEKNAGRMGRGGEQIVIVDLTVPDESVQILRPQLQQQLVAEQQRHEEEAEQIVSGGVVDEGEEEEALRRSAQEEADWLVASRIQEEEDRRLAQSLTPLIPQSLTLTHAHASSSSAASTGRVIRRIRRRGRSPPPFPYFTSGAHRSSGDRSGVSETYEDLLRLGEQIGSVQCGFSQSELSNLTRVAYTEKMGNDLQQCPICLLDVEVGVQVAILYPCTHKFHLECCLRWFQQSKICPVCRHPVSL